MRGVIVGYGTMGRVHHGRLRTLGAEVVAVVDPCLDSGAQASLHSVRLCTDLADLQNEPVIDFICICSPTHLHLTHIEQALPFGAALLVEKPVVRTPREADRLRQLPLPRPLMVAEVEQFNPALAPFLHLQGTPRRIRISRRVNLEAFLHGSSPQPWFLNEQLSGGIVVDLMIHDLTLLIVKYGVPQIETVRGLRLRQACIDDVSVTLNFGGWQAVLHGSWAADPGPTPIITDLHLEAGGGELMSLHCDTYGLTDQARPDDPFLLELGTFLESVRSGRPPFPLEPYLQAVELASAITSRIPRTGSELP